ncbi:MAG: hypothetical protein ABII27_01330 [bacterium]
MDNSNQNLIVSFIQVLREDRNIRNWFMSLNNLPENIRASELGQLREKLKNTKVAIEIITLTSLLLNKDIFANIINIFAGIEKESKRKLHVLHYAIIIMGILCVTVFAMVIYYKFIETPRLKKDIVRLEQKYDFSNFEYKKLEKSLSLADYVLFNVNINDFHISQLNNKKPFEKSILIHKILESQCYSVINRADKALMLNLIDFILTHEKCPNVCKASIFKKCTYSYYLVDIIRNKPDLFLEVVYENNRAKAVSSIIAKDAKSNQFEYADESLLNVYKKTKNKNAKLFLKNLRNDLVSFSGILIDNNVKTEISNFIILSGNIDKCSKILSMHGLHELLNKNPIAFIRSVKGSDVEDQVYDLLINDLEFYDFDKINRELLALYRKNNDNEIRMFIESIKASINNKVELQKEIVELRKNKKQI